MFNFFGMKRNRCRSRNLIYNLVPYDKVRDMIFNNDENILIDVREKNE